VSQENVDVVRACFDGWNRGDFDAWGTDAHPDIEFFSAVARLTEGRDVAWRGTDEMRQYWDEWHSVWDLRVQLSEIRDLGETVVAFGTMSTRGKASGAELDSPVAYVFDFDDGRFWRVRAYLDHAEALKAVGLEE